MRFYKLVFFIFLLIVTSSSNAQNIDFEVSTIIHNESEWMHGRNGLKSAPKDKNSFNSLYINLLTHYDINENIFLSFGAKANRVLGENNYDMPIYLRSKPSSNDINKEIISEASINYDDGFYAFNIGRQEVNYDWLLGNIDGILAMIGRDESYSLRLFWFDEYQHLQYNYYTHVKNINAGRGMYGAIAKANLNELELSFFNYLVEDLRNIAGTHLSYIYKNFGFNFSYSSAKALSQALYTYDESFINTSIEYLKGTHFYEFGYSKTGKNGLLAMLQMGNFMFGQFYLSNQVDRENAQNIFLKYIYANDKWRFELIGGKTKYDNSFVQIENSMDSYELDSYIKYNYSKNVSFDLGAMYMNVDERDPLQVDQTLMMFNMVVNYESY